MEVHQHTHTPRKRWKHYFWEFLMLFLAVFCGFLAEYQLEHKIEKDRERQFIRMLYQDLKLDTASLRKIVKARKKKADTLDSLSNFLSKPDFTGEINNVYYQARFATRFADVRFIPNDGTLQQLKSTGGLRLVHKTDVAEEIIKYDVALRNVLALFQQEGLTREEYMKAASCVFDGSVFDKMVSMDINNPSAYGFITPPGGTLSINPDRDKLFQLRYWNHYLRGNNILNLNANSQLLDHAELLLKKLEKEYKL